jgi:hypothetical protein
MTCVAEVEKLLYRADCFRCGTIATEDAQDLIAPHHTSVHPTPSENTTQQNTTRHDKSN